MKIKLDQCVHRRAKARLIGMGYDADNVYDEGIEGSLDPIVWAAAQSESRLLVTIDLDFSDIRGFGLGTHAGILLVRLTQEEQRNTPDWIARWFADREQVESWTGCVVVATEKKIRVRRPAT